MKGFATGCERGVVVLVAGGNIITVVVCLSGAGASDVCFLRADEASMGMLLL